MDFLDDMIQDQVLGPLTRLSMSLGDSRTVTPPTGIKLLWTDPPFGTNKTWTGEEGSYADPNIEDAIELIMGVMSVWLPSMDPEGVVCVCLDDRTVHDVIVRLKKEHGLFHRGDVIWQFGLGRPRTSWWARRHNTIATFTLSPESGLFDHSTIPREPRYEGHVASERYPSDKPVGSVWNKTMSNTDKERVGYPTQKPLSIVIPFVRAHTLEEDLVVDPFLGSGTTAEAAIRLKRRFFGCDLNPESIRVTEKRISLLRY